jgi:hypothetical protein
MKAPIATSKNHSAPDACMGNPLSWPKRRHTRHFVHIGLIFAYSLQRGHEGAVLNDACHGREFALR